MYQHFRVARHTEHPEEIKHFYINLLGLEMIDHFEGHDGYNGIMLGVKDHSWHLEFTYDGKKASHQTDADDLLVFYCDSETDYNNVVTRFTENQMKPVQSKNQYWDVHGITFVDPDGFRIVICKRRWD